MPRPNIVIVLEALYNGIDIEIGGFKLTMEDNKIYVIGENETTGGEVLLSLDFFDINNFIQFVDKNLTEEQRINLASTLALKKINERR